MNDVVNHPKHYTAHPSGIECIQITEHMGFNLGNAVKYIWRCDLKKDAIEDLKKAVWYIEREIQMREKMNHGGARPGSGRKPANFDEKRVVSLKNQGLTYQQIADRFGVSVHAIIWFFKKNRKNAA